MFSGTWNLPQDGGLISALLVLYFCQWCSCAYLTFHVQHTFILQVFRRKNVNKFPQIFGKNEQLTSFHSGFCEISRIWINATNKISVVVTKYLGNIAVFCVYRLNTIFKPAISICHPPSHCDSIHSLHPVCDDKYVHTGPGFIEFNISVLDTPYFKTDWKITRENDKFLTLYKQVNSTLFLWWF